MEVGEVIKGWDDGIRQMSKGERAKVTMPPDSAYGSKGFPGLFVSLLFVQPHQAKFYL